MPLLEFRDVSKDYFSNGQPVQALHRLSLSIEQGEFLALVGRSGCGKSTLLHLAGAMDFPTSGEVLLDGVPMSKQDEEALTAIRRRKVGFVFQSFQLLHTLSALENVELPVLLAGGSGGRAAALHRLGQVGIGELAQRFPHQLSGGQMQRVAIARALVNSPRILLADEPTGNLDSVTGDGILGLLRHICSTDGTTVIMATHSAEAAALADKVVRLRDGRIQQT